jgi:hypothetical protein
LSRVQVFGESPDYQLKAVPASQGAVHRHTALTRDRQEAIPFAFVQVIPIEQTGLAAAQSLKRLWRESQINNGLLESLERHRALPSHFR